MLKVGFAGAGFIAGVHAGLLGDMPDVQVAAVFDADGAQARTFAERTGARVVPTFDALLDEADAVYLCTPNVYHADLAVAALEAGRHVFSEKPMATSPAGAQRVREAAGRSAGIYQLGFNKRFAPIYTSLKERMDGGELTPRWAHIKMNRGELQKPSWVADESLTGGFLYETPIHLLDAMLWLFGPAREVVCRAAQSCSQQLDDFAMLLTFTSGLTATFCTSAHATWLYPFERLEVYGDRAIAVTEEMDRVTVQLGLDAEPKTIDVSEQPFAERWGYRAEDEAFVAAVRGQREPAVGVEEGLRATELVDACYRAAASKQAVVLAEKS